MCEGPDWLCIDLFMLQLNHEMNGTFACKTCIRRSPEALWLDHLLYMIREPFKSVYIYFIDHIEESLDSQQLTGWRSEGLI